MIDRIEFDTQAELLLTVTGYLAKRRSFNAPDNLVARNVSDYHKGFTFGQSSTGLLNEEWANKFRADTPYYAVFSGPTPLLWRTDTIGWVAVTYAPSPTTHDHALLLGRAVSL